MKRLIVSLAILMLVICAHASILGEGIQVNTLVFKDGTAREVRVRPILEFGQQPMQNRFARNLIFTSANGTYHFGDNPGLISSNMNKNIIAAPQKDGTYKKVNSDDFILVAISFSGWSAREDQLENYAIVTDAAGNDLHVASILSGTDAELAIPREYSDGTLSIIISNRGKRSDSFTLEKVVLFSPGIMDITSVPANAIVILDKIITDYRTPCRLFIPTLGAKTRIVSVGASMPGYKEPPTSKIMINSAAVTTCSFEMKKYITGSLDVTSDPPGASVYIDGVWEKFTPCQIDLVMEEGANTRIVTVDASMPGYKKAPTRKIMINSAAVTKCNFEIVKILTGSLTITSDPPGAGIIINGKREYKEQFIGQVTPCKINVELEDTNISQKLQLSLLLRGYLISPSKEVTVNANEETTCAFTLKKSPLPRIQNIPQGTYSGERRSNPLDSAEMVWVPAGEFLMGSADGPQNQQPQRTVFLDGYWIYKTEVTVAQYRKFCQATGWPMPPEPWKWQDDHPIVNVTWEDAASYGDWAGAALPTEAQWEKAARGTDGREYPWGNEWDVDKAQYSKMEQDGADRTAPVGSVPAGASPYGCLDMEGNVQQWCADWYEDVYYKTAPARNPTGPATSTERVVRGTFFWGNETYTHLHYFYVSDRDWRNPGNGYNCLGFRCVVRSQGL